ncbi:MAG: HD domain-containing protein [Patescibacteria group bacterium]|nr:HD domain-containing protein [Patescibacteria group bacterium]
MNDIYKETLDKIIFLYERYSEEHRASTQPFHLKKVKKLIKDYVYKYDDLLVREPLIEHSGSLPIVATTIYSKIDDPNVDLGRALIMLAIHDIGELITGDEMTFTKNGRKASNEKKQALTLLPESFHSVYIEMEERRSETARFAKAIDKMTPDIIDLMTPTEITVERYRKFVKKEPEEIVATIKEFKHPYMLWNDFMTNLHLEILGRIDKKLQSFYK